MKERAELVSYSAQEGETVPITNRQLRTLFVGPFAIRRTLAIKQVGTRIPAQSQFFIIGNAPQHRAVGPRLTEAKGKAATLISAQTRRCDTNMDSILLAIGMS